VKPRIATNNFVASATAYADAYVNAFAVAVASATAYADAYVNAFAVAVATANAYAYATVIAIKMEARQMLSLGDRLTVGPTPTVDFIGARSTLRALFTPNRSIGCGSCRTSLAVSRTREVRA